MYPEVDKAPVMATVVAQPEMDRDNDGNNSKTLRNSNTSFKEESTQPFREGRGYTPSGGSACQQSSRILMVIILGLTSALMVAALQAMFNVKASFDRWAVELETFEVNAQNKSDAYVASVEAFLANFSAAVASGQLNAEKACDMNYFANSTIEANQNLVETFELMTTLTFSFAIAGTVFTSLYLLTKCCVTVHFSWNVNREENELVQTAPSGFVPHVYITGNLETVQQRRTRVFLRSETLNYMFVNATLDIPLFTFVITYYLMRHSSRGISCADCFNRQELCEVDEVSDLDWAVQSAVIIAMASLLWNAALLTERWIEWIKFKREIEKVYFDPRKYATLVVISFLLYAFVITTPMILLYYYEIGPNYFSLTGTSLEALKGVGFAGVGVWILAFLGINCLAGPDPWEIFTAPALACEICEAGLEQTGCCCCC